MKSNNHEQLNEKDGYINEKTEAVNKNEHVDEGDKPNGNVSNKSLKEQGQGTDLKDNTIDDDNDKSHVKTSGDHSKIDGPKQTPNMGKIWFRFLLFI